MRGNLRRRCVVSSFLLASSRQRRRPLTAGHFKLSRYHRWILCDDAQSIRALHMDALYMWLTNDKHSLPPEWYMAMSVGVGAAIAAGFTSPSLIQLDNGTSGLEAWNRSERDTAVAANKIAPCSIIWASDTRARSPHCRRLQGGRIQSKDCGAGTHRNMHEVENKADHNGTPK